MDYNEVLQRARVRMAPRCKVCPECNGLGCGNTMPGPGSKAPGNGANDNWRAWRRWCLNMDTIAPNTPVDTSLELLGRTFSLPLIAAPIGSLRAQFHPEDDIRDYNACCIAAAAQTDIAASFGDGLDARVFPHGCALSQQYGGIGLPVINPLSMDTIKANLDLANAAQPFAVSVVIDSAGLPHLKAASPDAGSKTVAELRELCDYAQMPMILKGIMTVRGAEKAVEAGAAAIVVSNHGGRVLPGSAATADVLPEIADAVGDRVKILVDGGIRSGTDIFRALALGADAVMICRPFLISYYGGGTEGIVTYVEVARGADGRDVYVRRALPRRHHARHGARGAVTNTAKTKQLRSLGFAAVFALPQVLVARDAVIVPQQNGLEGRQQLHVEIEKVDRKRHGERPCAHAEQPPREFRYLHRSPSFLTMRFRPAGPRSTGRAAPHA